MRNKVTKMTTSILLVVSVLCSSFSVFATDTTPNTTVPPFDDGLSEVDEKLMSYYIWLCMRAWGINITYEESVEYNDYVESQIFNWVLEYLFSLASSYTINEWIAPWQSGYDYWGNYKFNNSALEDIQDFVEWLIDLLDLSNDQIKIIDPIYTVNGYTLYEKGKYYEASFTDGSNSSYIALEIWPNTNDSNNNNIAYTNTDFMLGYFVIGKPWVWAYNGIKYEIWAVMQSGIVYPTFYSYNFNRLNDSFEESVFSSGNFNYYLQTNNNGLGYGNIYPPTKGGYPNEGTEAYFIPSEGTWFIAETESQYNDFMDNFDVAIDGDTRVITYTINTPEIDETYTPGDSITIIGDSPSYSIIDWDGQVTVSNLPAVISTQTINNPGVIEAWRPINALITYVAQPIDAIRSLIYELPEEIVIVFDSFIGAIILFGMIKLLREH